MAGTRGYRQYRGRTSKAKVAAAIFLVLVILIAIAVMLLQRNIVYDETGTPHLELPWEENAPAANHSEQPNAGSLELTIEEAEEPAAVQQVVRSYALPAGVLTQDGWETLRPVIEIARPVYNAVAVTLKDDAGKVYFDASAAVSGAVKTEEDTAAVLAAMMSASEYTIARISCFHDPRAANSNIESMGLKNTGGYIFYDGNNSQWLDPAKADARKYLCDLAQEAAALGFDEILLTDVSYPTEGKLDKIAYGDVDRTETLQAFLGEMRAVLEPYSVALSIEVPESVLADGRDETVGLTLSGVAEVADRIYAQILPEQAEAYAAAVAAASSAAAFVPELTANEASVTGSCLVLG